MSSFFKDHLWHIFDQAVELQGLERDEYLETACAGDTQLRRELDELLSHADSDEVARAKQGYDFLQSPVVRGEAAQTQTPTMPQQIGNYRILSFLGGGSMGLVYEAEQALPRRVVALKVLRTSGLHTHKLHRFLKEVYILGQLRHPGIAQIYDAGIDEHQQPFFAMELVRGVPLDQYLQSKALTVNQRLELMVRVLDAVEHAHRRGIIHRDLKPGNILVDAHGLPKVLDFGVARITGQDSQWITSITETGQWLGTLAYMSPEQVSFSSSEIDSRSDVYALGLLLYEALGGRRAYDLTDVPLPEIARIIRECEAPPLGTLDSRLRGDLETIVAKAIEKERNRRYATPAELADDIRRYLKHESIRARPPSRLYRLRKFSRRNWQLLTIIATLMIGLVGTGCFASLAWQSAQIAKRERQAALTEAYTARIFAAGNALDDYNVNTAQLQLKAAPESIRGWEWQHLASRLGNYVIKIDAPVNSRTNVVFGAIQPTCYQVTANRLALRSHNHESGFSLDLPWQCDTLFPVAMQGDQMRACLVTKSDLHVIDRQGSERMQLPLPSPYRGRAVAFSQDLKLMALAFIDSGNLIQVYEVDTGRLLTTCQGKSGRVYGLNFDRSGQRLVSSGEDGLARVWDVATGQQLASLRGHQGNVWSAAWHPDGSRIVTASADGSVRQWNSQTGEPIGFPFVGHSGDVMAAIYSPSGQHIASTAHDRTVRIWDAESRQVHSVLFGQDHNLTMLAYSADGAFISGGGYEGSCLVWSTPEGNFNPLVLKGHDSAVYPVAVSHDGQTLVSGGWDSQVIAWNGGTGEIIHVMPQAGHPVRSLALTADNLAIYTSPKPPYFHAWNFRENTLSDEKMDEPLSDPPHTLSISPDDRLLAGSGIAGLQIWDRITGQRVATLCQSDTNSHKHAFSPDGQWFAGPGPNSGTTSLWSVAGFRHHVQLEAPAHMVTALAFSLDNRCLVTGGDDQLLRVWDIATGKLVRELVGHTDEVFAIAFHPFMQRMATGGRDRVIRIWDWSSGKEMATLAGHTGYVWSLAFTSDGQTLVSGSGDTTVRQWSTRSMQSFYETSSKSTGQPSVAPGQYATEQARDARLGLNRQDSKPD